MFAASPLLLPLVWVLCLGSLRCGGDSGADASGNDGGLDANMQQDARSLPSFDAAIEASEGGSSGLVDGVGFTADFRAFLTSQGYGDILRPDLAGPPGYGGRGASGEPVAKEPVIFVHGNSDRAIGGSLGGWDKSIAAFLAAGYQSRELYALTWGPASSSQASSQYHSKAHLSLVRHFIEAVLAYTGAAKVDIVSHSMGVTLARKAVLGGAGSDALAGGAYDLGAPLTSRVDTFLGIAGANLGLTSCYFTGPTLPTCGATNGFYPGVLAGGSVTGMSQFLTDLNTTSHFEGAHVFSLWSTKDEVLGTGTLVWGRPTATVPGEDANVRKDTLGHMDCKGETAEVQLSLVTNHAP